MLKRSSSGTEADHRATSWYLLLSEASLCISVTAPASRAGTLLSSERKAEVAEIRFTGSEHAAAEFRSKVRSIAPGATESTGGEVPSLLLDRSRVQEVLEVAFEIAGGDSEVFHAWLMQDSNSAFTAATWWYERSKLHEGTYLVQGRDGIVIAGLSHTQAEQVVGSHNKVLEEELRRWGR